MYRVQLLTLLIVSSCYCCFLSLRLYSERHLLTVMGPGFIIYPIFLQQADIYTQGIVESNVGSVQEYDVKNTNNAFVII